MLERIMNYAFVVTFSVSLVVFKEMKNSRFRDTDYEGEKRNQRN
jgi:hypothetical protein